MMNTLAGVDSTLAPGGLQHVNAAQQQLMTSAALSGQDPMMPGASVGMGGDGMMMGGPVVPNTGNGIGIDTLVGGGQIPAMGGPNIPPERQAQWMVSANFFIVERDCHYYAAHILCCMLNLTDTA